MVVISKDPLLDQHHNVDGQPHLELEVALLGYLLEKYFCPLKDLPLQQIVHRRSSARSAGWGDSTSPELAPDVPLHDVVEVLAQESVRVHRVQRLREAPIRKVGLQRAAGLS